jgi:hypothetical protein
VLITPTVNGRRPRQSDGFLTPGFCRERSGYNTRKGKKLASFTAGYQLPAPAAFAGIREGANPMATTKALTKTAARRAAVSAGITFLHIEDAWTNLERGLAVLDAIQESAEGGDQYLANALFYLHAKMVEDLHALRRNVENAGSAVL